MSTTENTHDVLQSSLSDARLLWNSFANSYLASIEALCDARPDIGKSIRNDFRIPLQSVNRAMGTCQEVLESQGRVLLGLTVADEHASIPIHKLTRNEQSRLQSKYHEIRNTVYIENGSSYGGVAKRDDQVIDNNVSQATKCDVKFSDLDMTEHNFPSLTSATECTKRANTSTRTSQSDSTSKPIPRTEVKGYRQANKRAKFVPLPEPPSTLDSPDQSTVSVLAGSVSTVNECRDCGVLEVPLKSQASPAKAIRWIMSNSYFGQIRSIALDDGKVVVMYDSIDSACAYRDFLKSRKFNYFRNTFSKQGIMAKKSHRVSTSDGPGAPTRVIVLEVRAIQCDKLRWLSEFINKLKEIPNLATFIVTLLTDREAAVFFPSGENAYALAQILQNGHTSLSQVVRAWSYAPDPSVLSYDEAQKAIWEQLDNKDSYCEFSCKAAKRICYCSLSRRTAYLRALIRQSSLDRPDPSAEEFIPGTAKIEHEDTNKVYRRGARWIDGSEETHLNTRSTDIEHETSSLAASIIGKDLADSNATKLESKLDDQMRKNDHSPPRNAAPKRAQRAHQPRKTTARDSRKDKRCKASVAPQANSRQIASPAYADTKQIALDVASRTQTMQFEAESMLQNREVDQTSEVLLQVKSGSLTEACATGTSTESNCASTIDECRSGVPRCTNNSASFSTSETLNPDTSPTLNTEYALEAR